MHEHDEPKPIARAEGPSRGAGRQNGEYASRRAFGVRVLLGLAHFRRKSVRENQGLTLAEVAERMGIDLPALSRLETGKMLNPTLATLHQWADTAGTGRV